MNGYQSVEEVFAAYREAILEVLSCYMSTVGGDFSPFLRAKKEFCKKLAAIREKEAQANFLIPTYYLQNCFHLSDVLTATVVCVYFSAVDSEIGYLCAQITKRSRFLETNDLIGLFFYNVTEFLENREVLSYLFQMDSREGAQFHMPLLLHNRIFAFLSGENVLYSDSYFKCFSCTETLVSMIGNKAEKQRLILLINEASCAQKNDTKESNQQNLAIALVGENKSGRKLLLRTVCCELGKNLIEIDWLLLREEEIRQAAQDVKRELLLQNSYCCVTNIISEGDYELLGKFYTFVNRVSVLQIPIFFIVTKKEMQWLSRIMQIEEIRLGLPSKADACALWQLYLPELKDSYQELAAIYELTPGQIKELIDFCKKEVKTDVKTKITVEQVKAQCVQYIADRMGKVHLLQTNFTLADLILPPSEKNQIIEGINHIKYGHVVYDQWNFKEKYPYNRGVSMLFEGSPGTGKTMAASVVGAELGLPVFQIDLSKVLSKYIGETEKQLEEIFESAQRNHAILFFDEMDALFGKRAEIKDSHDRYANIETSYLLQRMEAFHGMILMATNFKKNIDDAFLRRIQYVIHFPYPEYEQRLALWKNSFPKKANIDKEMEFTFLARQFELSGAMIKNIVLAAAFLAAAKEEPITMEHVTRALQTQMKKHGRTVTEEEITGR